MTIETLNRASEDAFLALIGGPLEGQLWLAERVAPQRPFKDAEALFQAFQHVVEDATEAEKIALIASHPDLADRVAVLSEMSQQEQASAGLNQLTPEEFAAFHEYNQAYKLKFGFPFVICARENTKERILAAFATRLENARSAEIETGVNEVLKILRLRLLDKFGR
jgi:2-oxo-4-hydroxy-4-carboxy-5-ureidoimidazoline decarboxylase